MHATGCVHCACARRALRRARTQHSVLLRVIVFHLHRSRSALLDRSWPTLGPRLAHAWPTLRLTHFGNFRTRHANGHARRPPPPVGIGSTALRVLSSAHTPQQRMAMRHTARPGTRRQRHTVGLHHYASSPQRTPQCAHPSRLHTARTVYCCYRSSVSGRARATDTVTAHSTCARTHTEAV